MKKKVKAAIALAVSTAMLFMMVSCSFFDKADDKCIEAGGNFMDALLDRNIDEATDLCSDEDDADSAFIGYSDNSIAYFHSQNKADLLDAVLGAATYEFDEKSADCSTKDKKGSVDVVITVPDYETVLDEEPESIDDFFDMLGDTEDTMTIATTLEFELDGDDWLVSNPEHIVSDVYDKIISADLYFILPYADYIYSSEWYWIDESPNIYYTGVTRVEFDIIPTVYTIDWYFYFEVYNADGTNLIYTSDETEESGYSIGACFYASDVPELGDTLPSDTYRIVIYDMEGNTIAEDTCIVIDCI